MFNKKKSKFTFNILIHGLDYIPLTRGDIFVRWKLKSHKSNGETSLGPIDDHSVVLNHHASFPVTISSDKHGQPSPCVIRFSIRRVVVGRSGFERMGVVEEDLSLLLGTSSCRKRYLLSDAETNATLEVSFVPVLTSGFSGVSCRNDPDSEHGVVVSCTPLGPDGHVPPDQHPEVSSKDDGHGTLGPRVGPVMGGGGAAGSASGSGLEGADSQFPQYGRDRSRSRDPYGRLSHSRNGSAASGSSSAGGGAGIIGGGMSSDVGRGPSSHPRVPSNGTGATSESSPGTRGGPGYSGSGDLDLDDDIAVVLGILEDTEEYQHLKSLEAQKNSMRAHNRGGSRVVMREAAPVSITHASTGMAPPGHTSSHVHSHRHSGSGAGTTSGPGSSGSRPPRSGCGLQGFSAGTGRSQGYGSSSSSSSPMSSVMTSPSAGEVGLEAQTPIYA